jgi:hypothetical protein
VAPSWKETLGATCSLLVKLADDTSSIRLAAQGIERANEKFNELSPILMPSGIPATCVARDDDEKMERVWSSHLSTAAALFFDHLPPAREALSENVIHVILSACEYKSTDLFTFGKYRAASWGQLAITIANGAEAWLHMTVHADAPGAVEPAFCGLLLADIPEEVNKVADRIRDEFRRVAIALQAETDEAKRWRAMLSEQAPAEHHREESIAAASEPSLEGDRPAGRGKPAVAPCQATKDTESTPDHSLDFRSVSWPGQLEPFRFTPTQAACVKVLWENWVKGWDVGEKSVLEAAESHQERLSNVFRDSGQQHAAWRTMIVRGSRKGTFTLAKLDGHTKTRTKTRT